MEQSQRTTWSRSRWTWGLCWLSNSRNPPLGATSFETVDSSPRCAREAKSFSKRLDSRLRRVLLGERVIPCDAGLPASRCMASRRQRTPLPARPTQRARALPHPMAETHSPPRARPQDALSQVCGAARRRAQWEARLDRRPLPEEASFAALPLSVEELSDRDRRQRRPIHDVRVYLSRQIHVRLCLTEASICKPGRRLDSRPRRFTFVAEHVKHVVDEFGTVAGLLSNPADKPLRPTSRIPGNSLRERPADDGRRCFPAVLSGHGHMFAYASGQRPCRLRCGRNGLHTQSTPARSRAGRTSAFARSR
jgi:hypothetical protein